MYEGERSDLQACNVVQCGEPRTFSTNIWKRQRRAPSEVRGLTTAVKTTNLRAYKQASQTFQLPRNKNMKPGKDEILVRACPAIQEDKFILLEEPTLLNEIKLAIQLLDHCW